MKKFYLISFLIFLLCCQTFAQAGVVEKSCIDCHEKLIKHTFIHMAVEDGCENCHESIDNNHPREGVKGFKLIEKLPELCFTCHENYSKANVHSPAAKGECMLCHSTHGSENKSLLLNDKPLLCSQCHDIGIDKMSKKHAPVFDGNCQTCHDPHQSDYTFFLKAKTTELCLSCHEKSKTESQLINVHVPFAEDCSNCHTPHGANNNNLLLEKTPNLCLNCHDELISTSNNPQIRHKSVLENNDCSNCHSPHASNQNKLLSVNNKELCLNCHSKSIEIPNGVIGNIGEMLKEGNHIHAIIETEGCIVCHNLHKSNNIDLLTGSFPTSKYSSGKSEDFELCFSCHDSGLMENKTDSLSTNFRNGNQNLHFVHLNGEKGRNCNMCHNIHGSVFDYLITDKVKFGNWEMPLNYRKDINGGTCNTGCHVEKKYFRRLLN